jgi:hypothetical protein
MQGTGKIFGKHEEKRPFEELGVDGANIKMKFKKKFLRQRRSNSSGTEHV